MVTVKAVVELLQVQPLSRRELAREFGVTWMDAGLAGVINELLRENAVDVADGYPERFVLTHRVIKE